MAAGKLILLCLQSPSMEPRFFELWSDKICRLVALMQTTEYHCCCMISQDLQLTGEHLNKQVLSCQLQVLMVVASPPRIPLMTNDTISDQLLGSCFPRGNSYCV